MEAMTALTAAHEAVVTRVIEALAGPGARLRDDQRTVGGLALVAGHRHDKRIFVKSAPRQL